MLTGKNYADLLSGVIQALLFIESDGNDKTFEQREFTAKNLTAPLMGEIMARVVRFADKYEKLIERACRNAQYGNLDMERVGMCLWFEWSESGCGFIDHGNHPTLDMLKKRAERERKIEVYSHRRKVYGLGL